SDADPPARITTRPAAEQIGLSAPAPSSCCGESADTSKDRSDGFLLPRVLDELGYELSVVEDVDRDRPPVLHCEREQRERLLAVERDDAGCAVDQGGPDE